MSEVRFATPSIRLRPAFYSLIQFCPDRVRGERVNIGIILEAPRHNYVAVKYRRYMERAVKCVDPLADVEAVRLVVGVLEAKLHSKQVDVAPDNQGALISSVENPSKILELVADFNKTSRSLWWVTNPKPIFVPLHQTFDQRLEILHSSLVANKPGAEKPSWDKAYVKRRTVDALKSQHLDIDENPDPLPAKGQLWANSAFDALHQTDNWTYLQFFSFDTQVPDLDQSKAFVTTVNDLREHTEFRRENRFYYVAVVQPPVHEKGRPNLITHSSAVEAFRRNDIPCFTTGDEDIAKIVSALSAGKDPGIYSPY